MSLKKQFLKNKPVCKVTFKLDGDGLDQAGKAYLVGEFNGWNPQATPMRKLKTGGFSVTLELEKNREYQFKYLVDNRNWENDKAADRYAPSPYGDSDNSVVVL